MLMQAVFVGALQLDVVHPPVGHNLKHRPQLGASQPLAIPLGLDGLSILALTAAA